MSLTCGFYDSLNGDRAYSAVQLSSIFDGVIEDGIFESIGSSMMVKANADKQSVVIGTGRAWFNHTWTLNDNLYNIDVWATDEKYAPDLVLTRIDALCLQVDNSEAGRINEFVVVKGTGSSTEPVKPTLKNDAGEGIHQYPLCYITIKPGSKAVITTSEIENAVGTKSTPFVTSVLKANITVDELLAQWQSQWNDWLNAEKKSYESWTTEQKSSWLNWIATNESDFTKWSNTFENSMEVWEVNQREQFDRWFANLKIKLDGEVATKLQNQIDELKMGQMLQDFDLRPKTTVFLDNGNIKESAPVTEGKNKLDTNSLDVMAKGQHLTLPHTDEKSAFILDRIEGYSVQPHYNGNNLIDCNELGKVVSNGVTFTPVFDVDGYLEYVTCSGKATDTADYELGVIHVANGTDFIYSGISAVVDGTMMLLKDSSGIVSTLTSGEKTYTMKSGLTMYIRVTAGTTVNGLVFYPSVRLGTVSEYSYEPYVGGKPSPSPAYPVKLRSSGDITNLLNPTLETTTINGVRCKNNGDGTFTLNGTASAEVNFPLVTTDTVINAKLVGCPKGGTTTTYAIQTKVDGVWSGKSYDFGEGSLINGTLNRMIINVRAGVTVNDLVFKPMLTTDLNATYEDFVPYGAHGITLRETDATTKSATFPIPLTEPLRSIGNVRDEVVKQNGQWGVLRRIGKVDLGELEWTYNASRLFFQTTFVNLVIPVLDDVLPTISCVNYIVDTPRNMWQSKSADKSISTSIGETQYVWICDKSYTDAEEFKSAMVGVPLYYELTKPTFMPFSDQDLFYYLALFDGETRLTTSDGMAEIQVTYDKKVFAPVSESMSLTDSIIFDPVFNDYGALQYILLNGVVNRDFIYKLGSLTMAIATTYILNGVTGSDSTLYLALQDENGNVLATCKASEGNYSTADVVVPADVYLYLKAGAKFTNLKIYPMVRKNGDSASYEPYALPDWVKQTIFNPDGSITELIDSGIYHFQRDTVFNKDGSISESYKAV